MPNITIREYRDWILSHTNGNYTFKESEDQISLLTPYATGVIDFVEIMDYTIIQMQIINKKDEDIKFFMHFELLDAQRAYDLFHEMEEQLLELKNRQVTKVLLSCSGGLTTSFFAQKANETAEYLKEDIHFDAIDFPRLYTVAFNNYDVVLLAPQIKYRTKEVRQILTEKTVASIPSKVFGTYDTAGLIQIVKLSKMAKQQKQKNEMLEMRKKEYRQKAHILSIAVVVGEEGFHIFYQLYENGSPIKNAKIIKQQLHIQDFFDVIKLANSECDKVDYVGICIPGVVQNGQVSVINIDSYQKHLKYKIENYMDLKAQVEKEFDIPCVVNNTTKMSALGYYASQTTYKSLTFYSNNPKTKGQGMASIIDGELVYGKGSIAGEIQLMTAYNRTYMKKSMDIDVSKPRQLEKMIAYMLSTNIVNVGPELICITSPLTPDIRRIRDKLNAVIPEEFLPDFIYVSAEEKVKYMLLGNAEMCMDEIEKDLKEMKV